VYLIVRNIVTSNISSGFESLREITDFIKTKGLLYH